MASIRVVGLSWHGTMVDEERGLASALGETGLPVETLVREIRAERAAVLEECEEYRRYGEVLSLAVSRAASRHGLRGEELASRVLAGLPRWPFYPEAEAAARSLAARFRLAVVANGDRDALEADLARLGSLAPSLHLVASSDVEAHKPAPDAFLAALHELEADEEEMVHLSDDPVRDLQTLHDLGIRSGWIVRREEELPEEVSVGFRAGSLAEAAGRILSPRRGRRPRG